MAFRWITLLPFPLVCATVLIASFHDREAPQLDAQMHRLKDCRTAFEQKEAIERGQPLTGSQGRATVDALVSNCIREGYLDPQARQRSKAETAAAENSAPMHGD